MSSNLNQKEVWDNLAGKWAEYRDELVPEVLGFVNGRKGKILDLGCGSGRNFFKAEGLEWYGTDFSENQIEQAKEKAGELGINDANLKVADCCSLPFGNNFFDCIICISVVHCIEGQENRKKAIEEMFRVLKPNSEAMISVWNKGENIKKGKKEEMRGFLVGGASYKRYYYFYTEEEFVSALKNAGFSTVNVLRSDYKSKDPRVHHIRHNIAVVVRKP